MDSSLIIIQTKQLVLELQAQVLVKDRKIDICPKRWSGQWKLKTIIRQHLPLPQSLYAWTGTWVYADVRTKISRMDRLLEFLAYGAPLVRETRGSSTTDPW